MENVQLCFQWRVHGSAQHQLAVEPSPVGRAPERFVHESPFSARSLARNTSRPRGEINYPLRARSHVYLMWRGRGARADWAGGQIFYSWKIMVSGTGLKRTCGWTALACPANRQRVNKSAISHIYVNKIKNKMQAPAWWRPLWRRRATTASKLRAGSARLMLFTINKIRFYSTETLIRMNPVS